jgi:hypothetical protein
MSFCIKNTFIDTGERAAAPVVDRSRAASLPPRIQRTDNGDAYAEGLRARIRTEIPSAWSDATLGVESSTAVASTLTEPQNQSKALSCNVIKVSAHLGDIASEDIDNSEPTTQFPAKNVGVKKRDYRMNVNSAPIGKEQGRSGRWWGDVNDVCPISEFPIKLLPCPPFRLHLNGEETRLVDGVTLLLTVLATWDFTVLGKQLTNNQIRQLDEHVKRCKLGPYRLSKAMGLLAQGTRESQQEFESMRAKAQKRLHDLKHIQRSRKRRENLQS